MLTNLSMPKITFLIGLTFWRVITIFYYNSIRKIIKKISEYQLTVTTEILRRKIFQLQSRNAVFCWISLFKILFSSLVNFSVGALLVNFPLLGYSKGVEFEKPNPNSVAIWKCSAAGTRARKKSVFYSKAFWDELFRSHLAVRVLKICWSSATFPFYLYPGRD